MAAFFKEATPYHVKWRNFLFPYHKYLCNSTFLRVFLVKEVKFDFLKFKVVANFSKSEWLLIFFKIAAIFQNGYPLTCKMEEFPFPNHKYLCISNFEFFLLKEAKKNLFEFKMTSNFFFKMAAP